MVTYLAKFIPNLSQTASPLRALLKDIEWYWSQQQAKSFESSSSNFEIAKPVLISVDPSSKGMGAVLLQDEHPVAYPSKALTNSQQNYAQVEKEMLAMFFGCTSFHGYIYGLMSVTIETDHKPLEMILNKNTTPGPHPDFRK